MKMNLTKLTDHSQDSKTLCTTCVDHYMSESNSVIEMLHGQFFAEQDEEEEQEEEEEEEDENYIQSGLDEDEFILPL